MLIMGYLDVAAKLECLTSVQIINFTQLFFSPLLQAVGNTDALVATLPR